MHFRRAPARFACFSTPARAVVWFYHKRRLTQIKWHPPPAAKRQGSFLRWQSCIGLPSRAKLARRRESKEHHYHSSPRTPFAASRRFPQGKTRNSKSHSFCLPDRDGAGRSPEEHRKDSAKDLTPLFSGAFSATSFLRKEALALHHAALVTQS